MAVECSNCSCRGAVRWTHCFRKATLDTAVFHTTASVLILQIDGVHCTCNHAAAGHAVECFAFRQGVYCCSHQASRLVSKCTSIWLIVGKRSTPDELCLRSTDEHATRAGEPQTDEHETMAGDLQTDEHATRAGEPQTVFGTLTPHFKCSYSCKHL